MEQISQPKILSGIVVREAMREKLADTVKSFSVAPTLVIIQIGEREDSNVYIKQKIKFGESIGVNVVHKKLAEEITEDELKKEIDIHNRDESTSGIIVQFPLPLHIDRTIIESIDQEKDVDCLTTYHQKKLAEGNEFSAPATARAILALLRYYDVPIQGKKAVVIGRSLLVGAPTAKLLELYGASVDVIHRQTENPQMLSRTADILVVAAGQPWLVTCEWINDSQKTVVLDVGIHRRDGGLVGDVDFADVSPHVSALSPVPGGVGPLTVACLFEQVVRMHQNRAVI